MGSAVSVGYSAEGRLQIFLLPLVVALMECLPSILLSVSVSRDSFPQSGLVGWGKRSNPMDRN